jgi:[NiFe] hydrogenase assembly HybE family chaperone
LSCRALGFARHRGDWLGVVITQWFVDLYLLPGGGELWGDIPSGQRRYVELPRGTVPFTAADDPQIGPYQYSPLISPVSALPDMAAAMKLANDVLSGIFGELAQPLPVSPAQQGASDQGGNPQLASRRGFLRRLAGKR